MTRRGVVVWGLAIPAVGAVVIASDAIHDLIAERLADESAALATLGVQVVLLVSIYLVGRWIEANSG